MTSSDPSTLTNLITDVDGIAVGHAADEARATGVTVITVERPNAASCVVRGGAPGGRDLALLDPAMSVEGVDAVVLSGGSVFGLDAAGGALAVLREQGRGLSFAGETVPIVVQAIAFDLANGGDKAWGDEPFYWQLGHRAATVAAHAPFALGSVGGGAGATIADLKCGLGSASCTLDDGTRVGAVAVVNALGSAVIAGGPHFWAAPYERDNEFGGLGLPMPWPNEAERVALKGRSATSQTPLTPATTIALVATDATLTKPQTLRLAHMADDGLARALRPAHAEHDGDTVFAVATAKRPWADDPHALTLLGAAAGDCLARAIARGVYEARSLPFAGALPSWRDRFGG
ncbi:MAG: P1 family peptidase [Pseudomonadota bacterium]